MLQHLQPKSMVSRPICTKGCCCWKRCNRREQIGYRHWLA